MTEGRLNRVAISQAEKRADIYIYDVIGPDWAGLVGGRSFADAMSEMKDITRIDVHINSVGGNVYEANAIYNLLKQHKAKVITHVDGIAASAATLPMIAGDEIHVAENAIVMIHEPRMNIGSATADELIASAETLEKLGSQIVSAYAARTGKPVDEIREMVKKETWMTALEAKEKGFATHVSPNKSVSAHCDLTQFQNVPEWCRQALSKMELQMSTTAEKPVETPKAEEKQVVKTEVKLEPAVRSTEMTIDVDELIKKSLAEERKRVSEITALCVSAKHPQAAQKFIDEGLSVADVNAKLLQQLIKDNVPVGNEGDKEPEAKTPEDKFKAEYAQYREMNARLGVSEAEYVKGRMIETGAISK